MVTVLRRTWSEILHMCSEVLLKGKRQALLVCFLGFFVCICKPAVSFLLFVAMLLWFSVLWIVPIMLEVHKKGAKERKK
jgi:hypothetical protein